MTNLSEIAKNLMEKERNKLIDALDLGTPEYVEIGEWFIGVNINPLNTDFNIIETKGHWSFGRLHDSSIRP